MPTCEQCGAETAGRFCANCGAKLTGGGAMEGTATAEGAMSQNLASSMCYLLWGITGVFFLVTEPYRKNRVVRFHALQSLFTTVAWVGLWILTLVLSRMLPFVLSAVLGFLSMAYTLGFVVLWLGLMYKAYQGEKLVLPVVGAMAEQQA